MKLQLRHILALPIFLMAASASLHGAELAETYLEASNHVQEMDLESRQVMSSLYEINSRMKKLSKKRDNMNDRLITTQSEVNSLAKSIADLDDRILDQRKRLSKRLRAMYMIGNEGVARALFSSASAQDLDQTLKYLKLISEHDLSLIKAYRQNVAAMMRKRERLSGHVKHLLGIQQSIKVQEDELSHNQESKSVILSRLSTDRRRTLEKLAVIRGKAGDPELLGLINLSFFEHKGQLMWPTTSASLQRGFGTLHNERYHYVLSHKGFAFRMGQNKEVKGVFGGRVVFAGEISGYQKTLIVDHGDHFYSVYGHLDQLSVGEGDNIKQGEVLAAASSSMYFEIRHFSDAIDPKPWLNKETTAATTEDKTSKLK